MTALIRSKTPPLSWPAGLLARLRAAWSLPLPVRDTLLLGVVTFALLVDYYHDLLPGLEWVSGQSLDRLLLNALIPLAAIVLLGESSAAYGLRPGNWRRGLLLLAAAATAMTPVIIWFAAQPGTVEYYAPRSSNGALQIIVSNLLDVGSAEFLFRGLLMGILVRRCGPLGVVIATFPFVFTHLGKPEIETLSCFFGGIGFGWLAWRTESVFYGGLLHTYTLSLLMLICS